MKKNLYYFAIILACVSVLFTSCNNDDELDNLSPNAKSITVNTKAYDKWVYVNFEDGSSVTKDLDPVAGNYNGKIGKLTIGDKMEMPYGNQDVKVIITRLSKDSVIITMKDLSISMKGKDPNVYKEVSVKAKVSYDYTNKKLEFVLKGGSPVSTGEGKVSAWLAEGLISGKGFSLKMNIQPKGMPFPFTAHYSGSLEKGAVDESEFKWDIAFHRNNVKTNGGSALQTTATKLESVTTVPSGNFIADEETNDVIIYDMSKMMDGQIGYLTGLCNTVLNTCVKREGGMPPVYTVNDKVYVLKTATGKYVKILFTSYTKQIDDQTVESGHISLNYNYITK